MDTDPSVKDQVDTNDDKLFPEITKEDEYASFYTQETKKAENVNNNESMKCSKLQPIIRNDVLDSFEIENQNIRKLKCRMDELLKSMNEQKQELIDLTEIAYERYIFSKRLLKNEQERTNHFQQANQMLHDTLNEHHNNIMQIFNQ